MASEIREFEEDKREAWTRYEKLESAWSESIGEIEERRKALDARAFELKEAEERQRALLRQMKRIGGDIAKKDLDNIIRRIDAELLTDEIVPDKSKSEIRKVCLNEVDVWVAEFLKG